MIIFLCIEDTASPGKKGILINEHVLNREPVPLRNESGFIASVCCFFGFIIISQGSPLRFLL